MACEKCWEDAFGMAMTTGRSQADCYRALLDMRKENPCTPEQQRGQFDTSALPGAPQFT